MLRIAALNESDSGEEELEQQDGPTTTREAEEAEAFSIYNRSLGLQRSGDGAGAERLLSSLLDHPFLQQASRLVDAEAEDNHHPGLPLLYLVHKNLAAMAIARGNLVDGMKSYLEAVKIDASEVTVWYKMGIIAKKLHNYPLAKLAFEQGLQCNENHWPCLDSVITVLYALNDFWMCLDYIGRALERDCHYTKGLVFYRQILKEQPSLASDTKEMFAYCDPVIHTIQVEEAEAKEFIQEAVQIREIRRELAKKPPPAPLKLPRPITELTWKCVGECLVELFDTFVASDPPKSLVLSLDLSEYKEMAGCNEGKPETKSSTEGETLIPQPSNNDVQAPGTSGAVETPITAASGLSKAEMVNASDTAVSQAQTLSKTETPLSGQSSVTASAGKAREDQPMEVDEGNEKGQVTSVNSTAASADTATERQSTASAGQVETAEGGRMNLVTEALTVKTEGEGGVIKEADAGDSVSVTGKCGPCTTTTTTVTDSSTVTADTKVTVTSEAGGGDVSSVGCAHSQVVETSTGNITTSSPTAVTTVTTAAALLGAGNDSEAVLTLSSSVATTSIENPASSSSTAAAVSHSVGLAPSSTVSLLTTASATTGIGHTPLLTSSGVSGPTPFPAPPITSVSLTSGQAAVLGTSSPSQSQLLSPLQVVVSQDRISTVSLHSPAAGARQDGGDHTYTSGAGSAPLTTLSGPSVVGTSLVAGNGSAGATAASGILTVATAGSDRAPEVPAGVQTVTVTQTGGLSVAAPPAPSLNDNNSAQATPHRQNISSPPKSRVQVSPSNPTPLLSALVASVPLQTLPSSMPPIQIPLPSDLRLSPMTGLASVSALTPAPAHVHASPPKPTPTTTPPPAHSSVSPSLPKFQFSTITARQVQALLQDPLPSTPLLSTPAPSAYSPNMAERLRQMTSLSQPASSSSPSTTASAQLQSLARLANLTNSLPTTSQSVVTTGYASAEQTPETGSNPQLSSTKRKSPLSQSTPVSAEVALQDHSGMGRGSRARRGVKRKRAPAEDRSFLGFEDYGVKRRSARVRNTRKEEGSVDFQKLLRNFLPSTLTGTVQMEEDTQTEDTSMSVSQVQVDSNTTGVCGGGGPPLAETETEDVQKYLAECLNGQGVIGMMYKYLVHLSSRDTRQWPVGVPQLYCKVYDRLHPHLTFPSLYCMDFPDVCYTEMAKMALVWCELSLDTYLLQKADSIMSPATAQRLTDGGGTMTSPFTSDKAVSDMYFITGMVETGLTDLLGDQAGQFTIRVYWSKARLAMADNQMETAVENLETVAHCLEEGEEPKSLYLPNCTQDKLISLEEVKRQQESLQRCQSLEETQRLFDAGKYQQVVDYLTPTFAQSQAVQSGLKRTLPDPERHAQLELLQDALFRLEDWGQCLLWGEEALNESLHHYRRAPTIPARDNWALTLVRLFQSLQKVLDKDPKAVGSLPLQSSIRLVQNLMRIIEMNHDVSDAVTEMPISSVLPWILLYRIIRHEEEKLHALKLPDPENRDDMKGVISSSLMLLGVAHEYLGRHAWCTRDSGIFLLFYMDVLAAELSKAAESVKEDLETAFEQCVLCLYKHPNKKGKARHLYDHNATPIDLTWAKCEVVFEYFKPKTVPEFDSYKTSTVSGELENLLHRIYTLIPDDLGPGKRVDQVREYIEGNTNVSPSFSTDSPILQELYYLMADYFFKNKEPAKAIKYYTYDVCFNSWRLDSWAGLALAKNCQIEQKLNSMELKIDAPFHRKSIAALRCFSRAVEIDESVRKLWIEYGALAYQLHSHASRQLRMQLWFPLTSELLEIAMETRVEMLATARNCYWKASECEAEGSEEEWLHHYMMGKVMEKKRAHPRHYLEHFKQAAIYLHEEEAKYPRKILYQHSPPHLSLEALEMYYRLHVAVLKYLLRVKDPETKNDMALFDRYVTEATESPFAQRKEKHVEMRESVSSADDVDSQLSAASIPPYSTAHQKPVYHMTPQDHNYSKQKSSGGETSDASCGLKDTLTETEGSQSGEEVDTLTASEIQSQDSADDNDQSSVIAAPGNRQSAAKRDESAMESDLGDSVAMETSSQDDSVVSSHPPREGSGPASETQSDKAREKVEAVAANKQEEMATEVVELHAETDSQVTGDFVDTKPLLLDKKVSGGFEPHFDPAFELGDSESQKSGKDSSCNRTSLLRKEQEMGTGTSQNPPTKPSLTEEVAGSEKNEKLEPVSAAVDQQDKSAQVASSQVKNPRSSPSDLVTSGAVQEAEQREAVTASCLESGELSQEEDIVDAAPPTGVQNDSRRVITALSLESGELSQEEDVISVHTTSCSVISISDEEDTPSRTSSHKRPLQQDSPSNKRARVKLDGEQTGGDGEGKEIAQEILSQEVDVSKAADVTEAKDCPMEVDEVICISPENRDVAEGGRDTVVTPETSTQPVTDARASGTKGHAGSVSGGLKEDRAGDGENKEFPEKSPIAAGVHRNVGGPSVGAGTTESSPLGGKVARSDPPSGGDKNILMPLASAQEAKGSTDSNLMKTADGVKQEPKSEQPTETDSIVILDDEDKPASLDSKEGSPLTKDKERAVVSDDQEKPVLSGDADQLVDSEKAATPESGKVVLSGDTEQADAVQKRKENEPTVKEEEFSDASVARSGGSEPAEKTTASGSMGTEPAADQKQNGVVSNQKGQTSDQRENGASGSQSESKASTSAQPSSGSDKPDTPLSEGDFKEWKVRLLEKCIAGLHVCLSRFPTHYKSIYRLAHLYYMSETHRNLEFARDLLLGNPEWQKLSHMPANGLFAERRANNLFQGTWKIPIEEIDRAGSFASHINRSVHLLLDVLRDLGDVRMLLSLHTQLRKKPDQGRKYLRDGERQVLARMAHSYALDAVARQLERPETEVDKTEVLVSAYRAYNAHRSGSDARRAMMLLVTAYQWLGLPQHGFGSSVEQAVQYCTALITSQAQAMTPKADRSRHLPTSSFTSTTPTEMTSTGVGTTAATPQSPALGPAAIVPPASAASYPPTNVASSAQQTTGSHLSNPRMSSAAGVQCNTALPAHFSPPKMPGTSMGDVPAALDLSSPKKQPAGGGGSGNQVVVDLTSPVRSHPHPHAARPYSLPPGAYPPPVGTPSRGNPSALSKAGEVTPQRKRQSSPFSSPNYYPSSGLSSTTTPRRAMTDDGTDVDLTSDPGDDLAVTSPDKLTSDVRHHFQGDML